MIRRFGRTAGCLCLAATITLSFFTPPAAKAAAMTASEEIIGIIKDYEGFRSHVYWDSGSAFIGYGTICRSTDYPNGITREKAEELLRDAINIKADAINNMLEKYNIQLTQPQFDALVDLSYNIGTAWMSSSSRLFTYLTTGYTAYSETEIVNAFATWCHVGDAVNSRLVERRIREAKMFLYGDYTGTQGPTYHFIKYDAGAGDVEYSIIFYETGKAYGQLQEAVRPGYTLEGWYTSDGVKITPYTLATEDCYVTARWLEGAVPVNLGGYTDVSATDWYFTYVGDLSRRGILTGYPDGTFLPDKTVTFGEALKLILRTVGFPEQPSSGGHWAQGYLNLAISKGIVSEGDVIDLNAAITRRQVAEIAAKSIGLPPLPPEPTFADTTDGYVLMLYRCGIITGSNETGQLLFYPDNSISRSELSAILSRMINSGIIPEE